MGSQLCLVRVEALDGEFAKVTQVEQNSEIRAALEAISVTTPLPQLWWLRPVINAALVGLQVAQSRKYFEWMPTV